DIRVILIKISDRMHNMRTLGSQLPNKQYKIAGETLYIYAPLANRLGLNKVKEELEDLSFSYEHPEEYEKIKQKLAGMQENLQTAFQEFIQPIRQKLDEMDIKYEIKARIKTPYSIWSKMQNKHVTFEEIYDILAVRIIFDGGANEQEEIAECFRIYAAASSIYKPHPERLRDWLSQPKANGYQALHTTLMSHIGKWVEMQIRSRRMDDIAEHGFASHWKYKEGDKTREDSENELDKWLHTIKEILDDPQPNAIDFLDAIKLNLYANEIFVVTPKGEFKTMPAGCTVLDFAFSVHTFLGTHCIGAKVNHKLVPISHALQSGDQVEVLTSKNNKVTREWMQYATTAKAQGKIMSIVRRQEREQVKKGEELLRGFCEKHDREVNSVTIDCLCSLHNMESRDEFFAAVGAGTINLGNADRDALRGKESDRFNSLTRYIPFFNRGRKSDADEGDVAVTSQKVDKKKPLLLNEENLGRYALCDCCRPIPGDDVLGYFDGNATITIHKRQCPIANKIKASDGNHILAAKWDTHKQLFFPTTIHLEGIDRVGVLHQISGVLSHEFNVNMHRLSVETYDGIFKAEIHVSVHDDADLQNIIKNLKKIPELEVVSRF
ncbi:MAG: bifunctional (p)ppGpp synthetase/guanosine-3',5'-bis(diphosphate) 3'-pyrophosphohydrolase, partial [Bacteroidaceae bacterium]|nr:bifunctional (p)ppGpp synthetase/guanosine-3',5'-bis(diphosphate) 3'-pyrophosphohydrolase [Bacteroidaceae bacterium]